MLEKYKTLFFNLVMDRGLRRFLNKKHNGKRIERLFDIYSFYEENRPLSYYRKVVDKIKAYDKVEFGYITERKNYYLPRLSLLKLWQQDLFDLVDEEL